MKLKTKISLILILILSMFILIGAVSAQTNSTTVATADTSNINTININDTTNSAINHDNTNYYQETNDTTDTNTQNKLLSTGSNNEVSIISQTGETNNLQIGVDTVYISPDGSGNGLKSDSPTTWDTGINLVNDGGTINFASGTYTNIVNQTISKNLTLYHDYTSSDAILDAQHTGCVFYNPTSNTLNINGLSFVNGTGYLVDKIICGGAIYSNGNLNVNNSKFINNTAYSGGAICVNVTGTFTSCIFKNNNATFGGAIRVTNGDANVTGSTFINNNASKNGGGIAIGVANLNVTGSTFINNSANNFGGAFYVVRGKVNVTGSTFINNTANNYGGAITLGNENVNVIDSIFINNTAKTNGAAIAIGIGNLNVTGSIFINNTANNEVNAIYINGNVYDASYNWWGDNTPFTPDNKLIYRCIYIDSYYYITPSNWVIMTLSVNSTNVTLGDIISETVSFTHYTDGNNTYNMTSLLPEIPFTSSYNDGYTPNTTRWTENDTYTIYYHAKASGNFTGTFTTFNQTLTYNFTVNPLTNKSTVLNTPANLFIYGNNTYNGTLLDSNNNGVAYRTVSLNLTRISDGAWKVYNVTTNIFGEYSLPITLAPGLYEVSGLFNGDKNYNPSNVTTTTLTIVKDVNSTILTANTFHEKYKAGKNFTGFLLNSEGEPIVNQTIAVKLTRLSNGLNKVYYVTTDSNGMYQLPINLGKGSYMAECSYNGTSVYESSSASASLTVSA